VINGLKYKRKNLKLNLIKLDFLKTIKLIVRRVLIWGEMTYEVLAKSVQTVVKNRTVALETVSDERSCFKSGSATLNK